MDDGTPYNIDHSKCWSRWAWLIPRPSNPTKAPLRVGDLLYGYCGGHFGRDSHGIKRVEAIGSDWIVVREQDTAQPNFYEGSPEALIEYRNKPGDLEHW